MADKAGNALTLINSGVVTSDTLIINRGDDGAAPDVTGNPRRVALSTLAGVILASGVAGFVYGSSQLALGVDATTAGKLQLFGSTSGNATLQTPAAAGSGITVTLPGVTSTLAILGANTFTALQTLNGDAIGATSTARLLLTNTTAAAAGAQQWSPAIQLTGQGWKTAATAASQTVDWRIENVPVEGAANPTTRIAFSSQVNGAGFVERLGFGSDSAIIGVARIIAAAGNTLIFRRNGDTASTLVLGLNVSSAGGKMSFSQGWPVGWSSGDDAEGTMDTILKKRAAASINLGAADAASPVAQTFGVQSVVTGTADTAGANWTLRGSVGTGTGAGGDIIFQTAPAGTTGTAQNALATALTIKGSGKVITAASIAARAGFNITDGTAPTSPVLGDLWAESGVLKYFDGSTTKSLAFV